jgi:hypothetical protein
MKPFRKVLAVSGVILLTIFTIAGVAYALTDIPSTASKLSHYEAKARAVGLFVTTQEYIDSITVPEKDNSASIMAPILERFKAKYKDVEFENRRKNTIDRPTILAAYNDTGPDWKQIDEATKFKYCIFPRDRTRFAFTLFPEFASYKLVVRLLCLRAHVAIEQNDHSLAAECWNRAARLSLMVDDEPILIGMLVRISCAHIIEESIWKQLIANGNNPQVRSAAWLALETLDKPHEFFAAMRYEHLNTIQNLESIFQPTAFKSEDGDIYASDMSLRIYSKIPRIREASLANVHMLMAGYFERVDKGDFEFQSITAAEAWHASVPKTSPSFILSEMIRPELYNAGKTVGREYSRRNTLMQAIKLLENPTLTSLPIKGRYSLDSDGKPLRLIKKQRSLVIYSLGPNDADDGGILEVPKSGTSQDYDFGLAIPP